MKNYFADLHIHIGRSEDNSPIKITAARNLTLANILNECLERKGIDIIGVVDAGSPKVQQDLENLIDQGSLTLMQYGGLSYYGKATLLLGAEVETTEENGGSAHFICYFPYLQQIKDFTRIISKYIKNVSLSSQKARLNAQKLFDIVKQIGGIFIPAHVFTPHKSVYGNCTARLKELFTAESFSNIYAIELGLSSDTYLADRLSELRGKTFLSNSDAHSLPKIGREYNIISLKEPNYREIVMALKRQKGREVVGNYGLNPRLGKYHRTHCLICDNITESAPPVNLCSKCGSDKIVKGVLDRIEEIADCKSGLNPEYRPEYYYQVPLGFIPGIGSKTIDKLIDHFGTEMAILHEVSKEELTKVVGEKLASYICLARSGEAHLMVGGGGRYGKMVAREE